MRELFIEELVSIRGGSNTTSVDTTIWRCEEVFTGYSLEECIRQTVEGLPPFSF